MISSHAAHVMIDLPRVRENALAIARQTGVPLIAVVKADAYGLGAAPVAAAIAEVVDGFYVLTPREAVEAALPRISGRQTIVLLSQWDDPAVYIEQHLRPVVWTTDRASALRLARPVVSVDTGQQRFAAPIDQADAVRKAGDCDEAMTHATTLAQARQLVAAMGGKVRRLHAAGSALLDEPQARLDAVRPGLALYRGAARVVASLLEVRDGTGPAGYSGFVAPRHGIIFVGYSSGLRPGPCRINGRLSRVIEVGMQTSFVLCEAHDRAGDEVVLLGDGLTEQHIASAWGTSPQLALLTLCGCGQRRYARAD